MNKLKKHLYLLQLEEYNTKRFKKWLKNHDINKLKENKNKLKYTPNIILIILSSLPLMPFLKISKSIILANNLIQIISSPIKQIIIFLAKIKLSFFPNTIRIIITGSYGKTTFKEKLSHILTTKYSILKTPKNINTDLGIAILILSKLKKHHHFLIIEAGAYDRGDIKKICQLIKPDFAIVTVIGWMHLERFKTIKNIRTTKLEVIPFIKNRKQLFFPKKNHQFIDTNQVIKKIAQQFNIPLSTINTQIKQFTTPPHRLNINKNNSNLITIDDTYNSNPLGFKKALTKLKFFSKHQKIIVTPGMVELGSKQYQLNKKMAKLAGQTTNIFVIIGQTNKKALLAGAKKTTVKIILVNNSENWGQKISPLLKPPTIVLLENELPDHYF
ncbi:hypothetical protein KKA02_02430 [Patescibacteria group bacterium]|nr:hypothetical protein [Patescibacteria group bacterium]